MTISYYYILHVSHIFKLASDIAPLGERVRKTIFFFYVVTNRGRKVVQSCATLANRLEMNSRHKIRWIHAAVARQTRNRG